MKIKIVREAQLEEFEKTINLLLKEGWKIQGSHFIHKSDHHLMLIKDITTTAKKT